LVSPHRQAYAVKEGKMQGSGRIIFFKSLIEKIKRLNITQ